MKYLSVRPLVVLGALLLAGFATAPAQDQGFNLTESSSTQSSAVFDGAFVNARLLPSVNALTTEAAGLGSPDLDANKNDRAPQAIGATQQPQPRPTQIKACPVPGRIFPMLDYNGPMAGLVNPSHKPVVPRGLDGRSCALSVNEKFALFAKKPLSAKTYLSAAYNAGVAQWEDNDPEWGQGAEGYAQRYAAAYADQLSRSFFRQFMFPVIFSQDPRYYRGEGSGGQRFRHAIGHTFVSKDDNFDNMPNYSQWFGTAAAVALGNLYHPGHKRGFMPAAERFGTQLGTDMGLDVVREFWPEIVRKFHLPFRTQ